MVASSDQSFCLPFYPGIGRAAFAPSALPSDVNTPRGPGCVTGRGRDPRGHRGCATRAGPAVSDLHSPLRDEPPPLKRGSARRAASAPARVCSGVGKASRPERGWRLRLAEALTPARRRHPGPTSSSSFAGDGHLLRDSRTRGPAAAWARRPQADLSR